MRAITSSVMISVVLLSVLCGCGGEDNVFAPPNAFATGGVTATLVPRELLRDETQAGLIGEYVFDLTVTNTSGASIWVVDDVYLPTRDVPDNTTITLHFDTMDKPTGDGILYPTAWKRPNTTEVQDGQSLVREVRFNNPVVPNLQWPEVDPAEFGLLRTTRPLVTLNSPMKVTAVIGYGTSVFDAFANGDAPDQVSRWIAWQTRITTKEIRVTFP